MLFDGSKMAGLLGLVAGAARAEYTLDSYYDVNNFFNEFSFFTEPDPTHGFVEYVNSDTAFGLNLASTENGVIRVGADAVEANPPNGRKSVRMTSNKAFTHGLIIGDFGKMPSNLCGVWPAFWTFGPDWPNSGEIDIIEGVNDQSSTAVTLHTGPGCVITNEGTDPLTQLNDADCNTGGGFTGCGQQTSNPLNYGEGFNGIQGGVYAMEWTSDFISVWFFPRGAIPVDIGDGRPDPATWGLATARFVGSPGCDLDSFFREHNIIINTTFCGDWAGNPDVWNNNPVCSSKAATCQDFVSNNPQEFADAHWLINSISVYQNLQSPNGTVTQSFRA
ncbi:hypothetical protein ACO1O0_000883 [Amphichorda felina]